MAFSKKVSKVTVSGCSLKPKFEIFILFVYLDSYKDFQPNLEVFAKIEIFTLFVWLDF